MEENNDLDNINDLLDKAISKYDFDLMIDCIKKGSRIDDTVLHRIINRDRVDLFDYLLFSSELKEHFPLHYDYDFFGKQPAFIYACSCGSHKILDYLLNESKLDFFEAFDFKTISQNSLNAACRIGSIECVELLLNHEKTKSFCSLESTNFAAISTLDNRVLTSGPLHPHLMQHLVLTQDIDLVKKMKTYVNNLKDVYNKTLALRELSDSLNNAHNKIDKQRNKI